MRGEYEVGMQDQAFLGPESGLAIPCADGGVELAVATQWLHADRDQVAAALGLAPDKVRITLAGVGGAFGAREDISMQVHACLLALRTGRPVKMSYGREESFLGHVHRHPARLRYEHGATAEGRLVYVRARVLLDGGAYASTSGAVCSNAASFACGPYVVPSARIDTYAVYTNNPPCGAMRGFGAVQVGFAYESQMDKLARALAADPVELRLRNALAEDGRLPTGQAIRGPAPVAELLERLRDRPLPPAGGPLPGGAGGTTRGEGVRRGVGYAVGIKNTGFSEGFDDYATARVRVALEGDDVVAEVQSAASEVGQGVIGIQAQIVRTELGIEDVRVLPADTHIGSAGSTSASRQTYMTGGAVKLACDAVRELLRERAAGEDIPLATLLAEGPLESTQVHHHRPTHPLDERGQGDQHLTFSFAAHRAVVDVDCELGLARVVEIAAAQDVGLAINPQAVEGQIEGGTVQGVGLALMEEIQLRDGELVSTSFTDYHIPTVLDVGEISVDVLECPDPGAPYGLRGIGEPPTISSTPAVVECAARGDRARAAARARAARRPDRAVTGPSKLGTIPCVRFANIGAIARTCWPWPAATRSRTSWSRAGACSRRSRASGSRATSPSPAGGSRASAATTAASASTPPAASSCRASSTPTCTSSPRCCCRRSSRAWWWRAGRRRWCATRTSSPTCSASTARTGCSTRAPGCRCASTRWPPRACPRARWSHRAMALGTGELAGLLRRRRVLGVAEVMDFPAVIAGDPAVLAKVALHEHVDGHAPGVVGRGARCVRGGGHPLRPRGDDAGRRRSRSAGAGCGCCCARPRRRATCTRCSSSCGASGRSTAPSARTTGRPRRCCARGTSTPCAARRWPRASRPRTRC